MAENNLLPGLGPLAGYYFDNPATLFYIYQVSAHSTFIPKMVTSNLNASDC
jgi:hypothetical protein